MTTDQTIGLPCSPAPSLSVRQMLEDCFGVRFRGQRPYRLQAGRLNISLFRSMGVSEQYGVLFSCIRAPWLMILSLAQSVLLSSVHREEQGKSA